jgi:hypothetical protein
MKKTKMNSPVTMANQLSIHTLPVASSSQELQIIGAAMMVMTKERKIHTAFRATATTLKATAPQIATTPKVIETTLKRKRRCWCNAKVCKVMSDECFHVPRNTLDDYHRLEMFLASGLIRVVGILTTIIDITGAYKIQVGTGHAENESDEFKEDNNRRDNNHCASVVTATATAFSSLPTNRWLHNSCLV